MFNKYSAKSSSDQPTRQYVAYQDDLLPSPNPIILNQILTWLKRLNSELFFCIVDSDNGGCDRYLKFWSVEACPKYRTCYPMKLRC